MKKIIALMISALICFSVGLFAACGGDGSASQDRPENEQIVGGNGFNENKNDGEGGVNSGSVDEENGCQENEEEKDAAVDEKEVHNIHKWGSWQTVFYPDCVENGLKICNCTECGVSKMEIIPALNHTSEKWENNQSEHYRVCTRCGEKYDAAEHSFAADLSCACGYICDYSLGLGYEKIEGKEEYRVNGVGEFSGDIITVPATYKGLPVTEIGQYAFKDVAAKKVVLPDSVKNIGYKAFGYSDVEEAVMPGHLETLGGAAFENCVYLEKINLPDGLKTIPVNAFYNCTSLRKIIIPDSVVEIESQAFHFCYSLAHVTLGKNLERMYNAFRYCVNLYDIYNRSVLSVNVGGGGVAEYAKNVYTIGQGHTNVFQTEDGYWGYIDTDSVILLGYSGEGTSITIPETLFDKPCVLAQHSFMMLKKIESMTIPGSIKNIPSYSFTGMTSLTELTLGEGIQSVKRDCFSGNKLAGIRIPASLVSIESGSFGGNLTEIDIDENNPVYEFKGNCLIDSKTKTLLRACKDFVIPADGSVEAIGDYAFGFASDVQSVEIPSSVREIGTRAFFYSGFNEIILNEDLESIGVEAFAYCDNLTEINIPSTVKEIYASAFVGSPIEKVYFENTDGWVIYKRSSDVEGESADAAKLSDPLQAAEYIKEVEKNADLYSLARWERNL